MSASRRETDGEKHRCPKCGSRDVMRRVEEDVVGRVVYRVLGLRRYTCGDCRARFLDRPTGRSEAA